MLPFAFYERDLTHPVRSCAQEVPIQSVASIFLLGASLLRHATQVSTVLHTFFLAMLLYPDIQARARRELEAAIGVLRLPTFEDFGSVPYIDALIKELLRWQPVVPLGTSESIRRLNNFVDDLLIATFGLAAPPHKLREDDVYKGYHLEKDSLVIANIW